MKIFLALYFMLCLGVRAQSSVNNTVASNIDFPKISTFVSSDIGRGKLQAHIDISMNREEKPQTCEFDLSDIYKNREIVYEGVSIDHTIGFLKLTNTRLAVCIGSQINSIIRQQLVVIELGIDGKWVKETSKILFENTIVDAAVYGHTNEGQGRSREAYRMR